MATFEISPVHKKNEVDCRKLFEEGQHKKAEMNASNNVYNININMMKRNNDLKDRERRRSARSFARSLYKYSFNYGSK